MAEQELKTLGRYQILAELGRGGFAVVYRAVDPNLDREVALKVLHPTLLNDPSFTHRFRREAKALATLRHPNIVTIYEVSEVDGRLYIAMELADGPSLAGYIKQAGTIPWKDTIKLIKPVCEALDYAHAQGVVHRDLKPANILIDKDRGPLLTDFGLARLLSASSGSVSMTMSGGILGTPAYIAPEVWEMESAGPPADIYSLGCIVHEMLTGHLLFTGQTPMQILRSHDKGPQYPTAWPEGVPDGVASVLDKALARLPGDRYPSALGLWQELDDVDTDFRAAAERAQQAALAVEWQAAVEEAVQAQEWSTAKMAVGRWLAVAPSDPAALSARTEIDQQLAALTAADQPKGAAKPAIPIPQSPAPQGQNISVQAQENPPTPVQNNLAQNRQPTVVDSQSTVVAYPSNQPTIKYSQAGANTGLPSVARSRRKLPWVLGIVGLLVVGVTAAFIFLGGRSSTPNAQPTQPSFIIVKDTPSDTPSQPSGQMTITAVGFGQPSVTPSTAPIAKPTDIIATILPTSTSKPPLPTGTLSPTPVVTTALAATATSVATPRGGGNGKIAYASSQNGDPPQIWLMDLNGTPPLAITHSRDGSCQPAWSPDGKQLVFVTPCPKQQDEYPDSILFLVNADGTNLQPLPSSPKGDFDPAWSPDGTKIAFTSLREGMDHVYVIELASFKVVRLTGEFTSDRRPSWSPDGKKIAFESTRLGVRQIWTMDANGDNQAEFTRLTDGTAFNPIWSNDGNILYYNRNSSSLPVLFASRTDVFQPPESRLTNQVPLLRPRLSRDGLWFIFESWGDGNHNLYIMRSSGSSRQAVTNDTNFNFDPVWGP